MNDDSRVLHATHTPPERGIDISISPHDEAVKSVADHNLQNAGELRGR